MDVLRFFLMSEVNMKNKTGWLTVTRKCNNACKWCYTKNKLNCNSMNYEDAKTCVDN